MKAALKSIEQSKRIILVPSEYCPMEWSRVRDLLKPAVERSGERWTMTALLHALCIGDQHLWLALDKNNELMSAMTTQIVHYPNCRYLAFQFLGGKGFNKWSDDMLETMTDFAKDSGCAGIEAVGRFGFWPFFKKHGFERAYCTYQKRVE